MDLPVSLGAIWGPAFVELLSVVMPGSEVVSSVVVLSNDSVAEMSTVAADTNKLISFSTGCKDHPSTTK